ncbi:hypothetical protein ILUMI_26755 [Ignelater luminosus]|uniref:CCHC-type domain-containing protein n=1 Tax=Ignelater luminosus TaxID=2038154 RepID=A0A8K0C425_IGNLU|nr:hypothetical protein ILUMI_26755 [Ignelater luminosus]
MEDSLNNSNLELENNAEDLLNDRINNLSKTILKCIPEKSDSIKVEARKACREATEKLRNHALEMLGMIRFLKIAYEKAVKEAVEIKNKSNIKEKVIEKVEEQLTIRKDMTYVNIVTRKPEQTFAIKISTKINKDLGQVEQLLKTNVQPSKLNVPIAKVKKIKTGEVIVECINKKDIERLTTVINTSQKLQSKEIIKGNPRLILNNIDKNLDKTTLIEIICKNNRELVESCGGIDNFKKKVKEKFRLGCRDKDKSVSVVLEVTSEARKEFLKRRIILEWESIYAKDYISLGQCYKCYRFGHKSDKCKEAIQICGKCGNKGHDFQNCKSNDSNCIVCVRATGNKKGCKTDHAARDHKCPTMMEIKERIIKSIDYGQ